MRSFYEPYRQFFALPDVKAIVLFTVISRLPVAMMSFAMLMFLKQALGSFAQAGTVVGAYFIAMAITAPVQGRLIDRVGPRWPLRITGVVQPLALALLMISALNRPDFSDALLLAILGGAFVTPITTLSRTLWRHRFDDGPDRRMAFAVDAVSIELNFTLGPALIALLLAVGSPTWAFGAAVACSALAVVAFLNSPGLKYWKHEPHAERHLLGPLTILPLWLVFICNFGLTFSFGVLEVSYAAAATQAGWPAMGGALLAINSVGSAIGGAVYGALHLRMSLERQYGAAMALLALMVGAHMLAPSVWWMMPLSFVAGLLIAPALTAQTLMISRLAPQQYATEAFTWSSTFIVSGIGIGTAVAGWLIEKHGLAAAFGAGTLGLALAVLLSAGMRAGRSTAGAAPG